MSKWLNIFGARLRGLFGREGVIRDIDAELRFHVEMETEENVRRGMAPGEARRLALRSFGNVGAVRDAAYEVKGGGMLESILRDARFGARSLLKNKGFTAVAVLTLALGIGANAAIFAVIDAVLLRPLPYPESGRLVKLYARDAQGEDFSISPADFLEGYKGVDAFEHLAAYRETSFNMASQDRPERVSGVVVSPEFFNVLGVAPRHGRPVTPALDAPGGPRVVVLGHALWQKRFGGDVGVLGRSIDLDGEPRTVVGVMPEGFQFPAGAELWASSRYAVPEHPLRPTQDPTTRRDTQYFNVVGRLRPGTGLEQARAESNAVAARFKQQYGEAEEVVSAVVVSLHEDVVGETRSALLLLVGAVAILLLIACANVANILLARGATRQKEIALRLALGAGRVRLVRQFLTESLLLALAGGGLGVLLALWGLAPLKALVPGEVLGGAPLGLDARVLGFTALVSLVSALVFGLFPALNLADQDLNGVLKEGGRSGSGGARSNRARRVLVVSEIALAAVLLTGAGLLIRSLERLLDVSPGFDPERVLTAQLTLPQARYPEKAQRAAFAGRVLEELAGSPEVESAAVVSRIPMNFGRSTRSVEVQGQAPQNPSAEVTPDYITASPGYFRSMSIPVLAGRDFDARDVAGAQRVVVVNEATARHFWPGEDALGKLIKLDDDWSQVVGVVGNVRQISLAAKAPPTVYVPYAQDPWPFMSVVVRAKSSPAGAAPTLLGVVGRVDRDVPLYGVRPMGEVLQRSVSARRWRTLLLSLFAFTALGLACLGIYGVTAYSVTQRTHEIGVRMTLGAQKRDVLLMVVLQGLKLAVVGVAVGLLAALALSRLATSMLYGVEAADPLTLAAVSAILIGVTAAACLIPARRAANVDPLVALKYE
ncbi:MAG TPA: ABC transporter permease [Pyrinomonadaceae bacterium]